MNHLDAAQLRDITAGALGLDIVIRQVMRAIYPAPGIEATAQAWD